MPVYLKKMRREKKASEDLLQVFRKLHFLKEQYHFFKITIEAVWILKEQDGKELQCRQYYGFGGLRGCT